MKLRYLILMLTLLIQPLLWANSDFPERPEPAKLVNLITEENILEDFQVNLLEEKLQTFSDSTGNQILIVVVDSLGSWDANQYATMLGQNWGIGQESIDNGIVLLLSVGGAEGQRDYYISVGYGLESAIPDLRVKRLQEKHLLPYLKQGSYFRALDETTSELMKLAIKEYDGTQKKRKGNKGTMAVVIFFASIIGLAYYSKKDKEKRGIKDEPKEKKEEKDKDEDDENKDEEDEDDEFKFGGGTFGGAGAGGKW